MIVRRRVDLKRIGVKKIVIAAVLLVLGIGAVAAGVFSATPKLVFEGVRLKNVGGEVQAQIDVNLCSVKTVGANFVMEYDPAIVVPSNFDTNEALPEATASGHSGGADTWSFVQPNRDVFPLHDVNANPAAGANPLREGSALGSTWMTAEGKKAVRVNLNLNNKYTPKAGETWLKVRNLQAQPGGPEVPRLELDASKAEGTCVYTLSFQVKDPAAFVKLGKDELKNVFKLSVKNGNPDGSIAYIDENKTPKLQFMRGAEFIDYEFDLKATIDKVKVDIANNNDTIKVSAAEIYKDGAESDLLAYLNAHARDISITYIGGAKIADSIVWGASGKEFKAYNTGHPDDPLTWDPKGGSYEVQQLYKKDPDQGDIYVKATVEVSPVKVIGYTSENSYLAYNPAKETLPANIDDALLQFPEKAKPIFDKILPAFSDYEISVKKDTWAQLSPVPSLKDFFANPPEAGEYIFAAGLEASELPAWATPDADPAVSVKREIGVKSEPGPGFDEDQDISAMVDDEGMLKIEINLHKAELAAGTEFTLKMPNGELIDPAKLALDPSEPIGAVNGGYEVELNKNMQGENAPGFAVLKVDAPQAPAGENKAYQIRVMQHINLAEKLGKWSVAFKEPGKTYSDFAGFGFEPRRNSYTGTEFTFDYSGERQSLFKYEAGTVLPKRIRLAGGDYVMTLYDGYTGIETGKLNEVEADDEGWKTEQLIKAPGNTQADTPEPGDTVVLKGQLADEAYYAAWGKVHNARDPKDAVTLKLAVGEKTKPEDEAKIESLYDFVFDTQKVGYTADKLQTKVFTVKNIGNTAMQGGKIAIEPIGADSAPFEIVSPLPNIIRPGETAQFAIRTMLKANVAVHEANVKIDSNAGKELGKFKISFKVTDNDVYRVSLKVNDSDYGLARTGKTVPPALTPYASYTYEAGDTVSITAIPAPGAAFGKWKVLSPTDPAIALVPNDTDTSVTFLMPASDVEIEAVFEEGIVAKLGLQDLKILGENADVKQLQVKDGSGVLTNAVFDSTIEQYYVLLPYEADKVKTEFTLKNAQVQIGGETYNVQVKANYKPGNVDLEPVKVGGTEKTYISNLVKTAEPPAEGIITVTVMLPDGSGGNIAERTYKVNIKRLINPGDMAGFEYGNSPYGLIMRDNSIGDGDKDVYKQQFVNDDYRFIKDNLPGKKLPAKAEALSGLWYNPRAWKEAGGDESAGALENYDLDDYALFVYAGESFKLPGVSHLKQADGTPLEKADLANVKRTLKVKKMAAASVGFVNSEEVEIELPGITAFAPEDSGTNCDALLGMHVVPGIYEIVYSYPDSTLSTAKVVRPLIVLSRRGDVDISLYNGGTAHVNAADKAYIQSRFIQKLYFNNDSGYPYGNLYRYRICDINNDGNFNDADAYAINRINALGLPVLFYPQL